MSFGNFLKIFGSQFLKGEHFEQMLGVAKRETNKITKFIYLLFNTTQKVKLFTKLFTKFSCAIKL